jgi:hypothetical protein
MKRRAMEKVAVLVLSLFLLLLPAMLQAQPEPPKPGQPPIAQQLVREGNLAIKLLSALELGTAEDEAEAESRLADVGIMPRNGWIADYPVTPDIVGELQKTVSDAAESGKISLDKDEALKRFADAKAELSLAIRPQTGANGKTGETKPEEAENYPESTVINNYYYKEGPPVVTYYAPPPDYYYMYSWVPYPFWWFDFWFPGFFILHDFHRTVFLNNRVVFVSNHFNDFRSHRVFRVDPGTRFRGRTFAGIGAQRTRGFINTGVPRSDRTIFNNPRTRMPSGVRTFSVPSRGSGTVSPSQRGGRAVTPSMRGGGRTFSAPSRGGGMAAPSSRGGGGGSMERGQRR